MVLAGHIQPLSIQNVINATEEFFIVHHNESYKLIKREIEEVIKR
jgi:hypothetical protein